MNKLTTEFDEFGELMHPSIVERFKEECVNMMDIIKAEDTSPPKEDDLWKLFLSMNAADSNTFSKNQLSDESLNFQQKIEISEEFYPNDFLIKKPQKDRNEKMDIIVVATLLSKIPNFANLTRTCEIFGINQLVIPNIKLLEDDAFKAISVTAEKWLNITEVQEFELADFLKYKKLCGYTLIALEQTRDSTSLEKFKFPEKTILLLGNEREGTPLKYIEMMDEFIEIPQYGQIRSLNVHISAVICVWECLKQKKDLYESILIKNFKKNIEIKTLQRKLVCF